MHSKPALALASFAALCGCGRQDETKEKLVDLPEYSAFHDVQDLPNAALVSAAKAVVHLTVGSASGTGFFINDSGRLMTNNHVAGVKNCPKTGCFIELHKDYQRGQPATDANEVFAVPQSIDASLDASILQIYQSDKTTPFASPAFLQFTADDGPALMHKKIYLIGHPGGALKKWSEGEVFDLTGAWAIADYFSIPGTSGSPVLNVDGKVVGLNHRISGGAASITSNSYEQNAYFSNAAALAPVLAGSTPGLALVDFEAFKSKAEIVRDEEALYNARQGSVVVTGTNAEALATATTTTVLDALAEACDQGLALESYDDPDAFDDSLATCRAATKWINCIAEDQAANPHKSCPEGDVRGQWQARLAKADEKYRIFWQDSIDYDAVRATGLFATEDKEKSKLTQAGYKAELDRVHPPLTPGLAGEIYYRLGSRDYAGVNLQEYLLNYEDQPFYNRYAYNIFFGLYFLYIDEAIDQDRLKVELLKLLDDGDVTVGDKLDLEAVAYEAGIL